MFSRLCLCYLQIKETDRVDRLQPLGGPKILNWVEWEESSGQKWEAEHYIYTHISIFIRDF